MLASDGDASRAEAFLSTLLPKDRKRVGLLFGDVTSMDMGLSGSEYKCLLEQVTCIHHMAARYHLGVNREQVERYNVGGTRGVIELALECKDLRRFNFWSTIHVSGDRDGVVMEGELESGQRFRNSYEFSKYTAEQIVRQMSRRIPSTVFRPGIIVGDSSTGEIDRYDGPYHLIAVLMNGPFDLQLPLPGRGDGPLHLVPIDFVIDAAYALSRDERSVSRTFHLVDPAPLSGRSVFALVAERTRRRIPKAVIPGPIAKAMLRLPLPWVGQLKGSPKTIMEGFNQQVVYNARNTLEGLRPTDIWCPSIETYVENLVRFIRASQHSPTDVGDEDVTDALEL